MQCSVKLFLEHQQSYIIGPGRMELLQAIEELGSLRQAAQKIGMSYRWAWGRIKDAEKALGIPLLMKSPHTKNRSKCLTPEAKELLAWYTKTEKELAAVLMTALDSSPSFIVSTVRNTLGSS